MHALVRPGRAWHELATIAYIADNAVRTRRTGAWPCACMCTVQLFPSRYAGMRLSPAPSPWSLLGGSWTLGRSFGGSTCSSPS